MGIVEYALAFVMQKLGRRRTPWRSTRRRSTTMIVCAGRGRLPQRLRVVSRRAGHATQSGDARACCRRHPISRPTCASGRTRSCSGSSSTASNIPACRPGCRSGATTRSGRSSPSCGASNRRTPPTYRALALGFAETSESGREIATEEDAVEAAVACVRCHGSGRPWTAQRARPGAPRPAGRCPDRSAARLCGREARKRRHAAARERSHTGGYRAGRGLLRVSPRPPREASDPATPISKTDARSSSRVMPRTIFRPA